MIDVYDYLLQASHERVKVVHKICGLNNLLRMYKHLQILRRACQKEIGEFIKIFDKKQPTILHHHRRLGRALLFLTAGRGR